MFKFTLLCIVLAVGAVQALPVENPKSMEDILLWSDFDTEYAKRIAEKEREKYFNEQLSGSHHENSKGFFEIMYDMDKIEALVHEAIRSNEYSLHDVTSLASKHIAERLHPVQEVLLLSTNQGIDVEECRHIPQREVIKEQHDVLVRNITNCVRKNHDEFKNKVIELKNQKLEYLANKDSINREAFACMGNSTGIFRRVKVEACNLTAGWKFFWDVLMKFLSFGKDIGAMKEKLALIGNVKGKCFTEMVSDPSSELQKVFKEIDRVDICLKQKIHKHILKLGGSSVPDQTNGPTIIVYS